MTDVSDIQSLLDASNASFATYTADQFALSGAVQDLIDSLSSMEVMGPNLIQSPTNYSAGNWSHIAATTLSNQGVSLDGTNNLGKIVDDTSNSRHIFYQGQLNPPAGNYALSLYLMQDTLRYIQLSLADANNGNSYGVVFDTQAGAVTDTRTGGSPTGTSANIVPTAINGLYLATITMDCIGGGQNLYPVIATSNSATPTYDGSGQPTYVGSGQSIFAWDASLRVSLGTRSTASPWVTAGYNVNTFHVSSFSTANVDTLLTRNSGFKFYLTGTHGWADTPASKLTFNGDGSLTLTGAGAGGGGGIYSIAAKGTPATDWRGTAFGGGAYFEATLSFDPAPINAANEANGFPAWWANPVEHAAESSVNADNWQGQADWFVHYTELDFFEYNVSGSDNRLFQYNGTVIDWSGAWTGSNYPGFQQNSNNRQITLPVGTDFTKPHRYGFLWFPATPTTLGYFQWYFDGLPTSDRVTYSYYDPINPPAPPATASSPWLYGVADGQHPVLHLNPDAVGSLRIYSVDVWQASAANNIVK